MDATGCRVTTSPRSSSSSVTPAVHAVRLIGATAYVILEDDITVIDAGMRGSLPRLHAAIGALGRSPADIARFILTHGHPDHAGGAAGAPILMHPADRDRALRLNAGTIARHFAVRRLPPTTDLTDGQELPVLGGLRVVHAPGHTPGSVCLYAERDGVLFSGDALWRDARGFLDRPNPYWSEDLEAARRSIAVLARLDVGTILFGHLPPLSRASAALRELTTRWH